MKQITFLLLLFPLLSIAQENASPDALMLRFPDVSANEITFVYAENLWVVSKTGGLARQITTAVGMEYNPKFSPDGKEIAFTANIDGNYDVYKIPNTGGYAERLTHHTATEMMLEWHPDGEHIVNSSRGRTYVWPVEQMYLQPKSGGLSEQLPLAYGTNPSFNADGSKVAYQPNSRQSRTWKRYQGGLASDIWVYDFDTETSTQITDYKGTDAFPMWHNDQLFFLSDRGEEARLNIWSYDFKSNTFKQITDFKDFDVKFPSLGPNDIIFENAGQLFLLDLKTLNKKEVNIEVPAELTNIRPEFKELGNRISYMNVSPTGKRAVFETRGEIFTVPKEHGSPRNLTNSSGIAERYPSWSPDGKYIAYFSDKSGEYQLYMRQSDGKGEEKQLTTDLTVYSYNPIWSPDSKKIVFHDKVGKMWLLNVSSKALTEITENDYRFWSWEMKWSPDSQWITFDKPISNNQNGVIHLYNTNTKQLHQVTTDFYYNSQPTFSADGKHLFFFSNRKFNPVYSDFDNTWIYANSDQLFVMNLEEKTASIFEPKVDEEEFEGDGKEKEEDDEEEKKKDKKKKDKKDKKGNDEDSDEGDDKKEKVKPVKIDLTDMTKRLEEVPIEINSGRGLAVTKDKVIYLKYPKAGTYSWREPAGTLCYYDLKELKEETIIEKISGFELSADGKNILYAAQNSFGIIPVAKGKKMGDDKLETSKIKNLVNPKEEWAQLFYEAWRLERDFFYDPNMHGVDWDGIKTRYEKLLPFLTSRADLNFVIGEMIGELNCGHAYVGGGDSERAESIQVGSLGCDFELDEGKQAYKFSKIYEAAPWDISRSPLKRPGLEVNENDYLMAVNGMPLDPNKDPWAAFQNLTNETVTLSISKTGSMSDAKDVHVKLFSFGKEYRLRHLAWIYDNYKKVEEASDGKIGYIYVPNTGVNGQNELVRQFMAQMHKEALIIDERFNGGGQIPDRFIELLNRPTYNYWGRRDDTDWRTPGASHIGPKVMLVNQWAGSGGDAFPYYFRKAGLGKIVGKRTWGGLVGITGLPRLIDGGYLSAPSFGFYDTNGEWAIEGYGVDPDVEIENQPEVVFQGKDPQLEKAIEMLLQDLQANPIVIPEQPKGPNRIGIGLGQ